MRRKANTVRHTQRNISLGGDANKLSPEDRPAHDWYRFVLSFPPHLVRDYLSSFDLRQSSRVLDPFCGTGTTVVECKKQGIPSVGIEANGMAHFASSVKVDWKPNAEELLRHATAVADRATAVLKADGITDEPEIDGGLCPLFRELVAQRPVELRTLSKEQMDLLLSNSISPFPLHKTLVLLDCLKKMEDAHFSGHERLALAKAVVFSISNLHFGPEVGVHPPKLDAAVIRPWLAEVRLMAEHLRSLKSGVPAMVCQGDARNAANLVEPCSIDAVITSPPYPNEKDYTRTTRLESVLLGFVQTKHDIRALKKNLVRSNTRSVYVEDTDDAFIQNNAKIQEIARRIEARRIELGKTSGFERMYPKVTKLYFGGMARHLAELRTVLRPGAWLGYVVGDQASYLRVMIRTGQLLGEIAQSLGYELVRIDLFRTRLATATKEQLREEVVVLRWPG